MAASGAQSSASRIVVRLVAYYVLLIGGGALAWRYLPRGGSFAPASLDALFGGGPPVSSRGTAVTPLDEVTLGITVAVAMLASVLLSLPVAWVYLLTRAKRGYQQSVVQLLIILPLVVSGIVLLVKYSITLAFSLAGIVAAVRFRNTLDDSKDAVYVFLATAVGLASAVNLPVAAVISIFFNACVLLLWYSDFGHTPVELDGRIAEKRLKHAKELARTGTFVARIDDEVFRNMTKDQLEGVAERAWRRARANEDGEDAAGSETVLRVRTNDLETLRNLIEPKLQDYTKSWRFSKSANVDGVEVVEYFVQIKKRTPPDELLSLIRAAGSKTVMGAEFL
jgi:hypothetical protein